MNKKNGFALTEGLLIILVLAVVGFAGWFIWDRNKNDGQKEDAAQSSTSDANSSKEDRKAAKTELTADADPYENWKMGKFENLNIEYRIPSDWEDISDNTIFQEEGDVYQEVKIKSADGFVIFMSVNNLPRGYADMSEYEAVDFKQIDSTRQWIITKTTSGTIDKIFVGSGVNSIGEQIYPIANVGYGGYNVEMTGMYEQEFGSIEDYNNQESVKTAKKVFESLKFNN